MSSEKDDVLKKLAEAEAKIEALEKQLEHYKTLENQANALQQQVQSRDEILWKRFEQEISSVPETHRDLFDREKFESPVDAFTALNSWKTIYEEAKKAAMEELGKTNINNENKTDPTKSGVKKNDEPSYHGDSRLEALRVLTNLTGKKE